MEFGIPSSTSRLTGEDIYAVFNRGLSKVEVTESGMLGDHPQLTEVLARHGIGLAI